ncbi:basic helix-loop-helix domain-containing protein USF3 [Lates japonicus]|uniref:Basic helix-loop-helix domain-containing protein USF3 n=1 Tax=Lates japonicus TaxID=270547 RepID=A0AAD3R2H1_LATJO|nr:basic helix-loop-helix domain-containing protein USF3 [Lates japonicus]
MPEMTETQTPGRKPKKKKNKESHNAVERHRKEKINAGINRIGNLLPCSQALKQSKNMILDQAFRYITELKKQNDTMLLEGGDKVQAEEIRRLRRQLEELRKESAHYIELLKAHDINLLEDPTVHWKGKQRCAKVAKVTPTHQLPKGIIVYSNGNVMCPAGKETSPGKQPSETLILQPPSEVSGRLRVNGALLQVNTSSSTPALLPGSTVTPTQSTPGLRVVEQCVVETQAAAPALPPSVSYITLQIPTATTALPQQPQPAAAAQTITIAATSAPQLPTESPAPPVSTLPTFTQTVTRATASEVCSWVTQDTAIRTVSYTAIPNSQALLRAGAAGSTQTTWTTLQMAGNTVQPVCQSLPTPEVSNTAQPVQQVTLCPVGNKPSVQPIQIQMQPNVPAQQAPITAHIQAQPFQRAPQLRPAILNQAQPQPVLAPQPQCAVLPQSAIVPQPAVVAHPAVVSQPQPAVLQPASLLPNPPTALIPQPQALPQPALVPQPQATVLPLLQTMQVLQVNPTGATASGVTAPQNTNNPSVVILQQASSCPTQSVVREEITNQTPCQHIVIIQAPNQAAPAPQNPPVGMLPAAVPAAVPAVSTQISTTSSSTSATSLQSVGGKQLVHILPRPAQPQVNHPLQVTQASSSPPVPPTPQTITVNGQVFALQPMKTSDKASSQGGQSTLQLVQPTTSEEPTTNVALNSLGALSSLNQSISQGLPLAISSQNNAHSSVTAPSASSDFRKRVSTSRAPTQQTDINMSNPSPCHPTEVKPNQAPRRDRESQEERHSISAEKEGLVAATSDTPSRKDFALSQQVYTNLDDQTLEHPMTSSRQTDSPMSSGAGGGRGFSVASMLPQGHSISASSGSFGTFTFTSEQAEMLALAMLEQDSPGRRSGGCSGDNAASTNPTTAPWEPPKTPPVSASKERGSTGQQAKVTKPMDTVTVKAAVQVSVRGQVGEGAVSGPNGSRHPQNITYSQSQSLPQVQSQSSSQSGTVASLSVNNLIRPSSTQQPYPGSPSLAGQQGSVPSPVGTSGHISQASSNALSPCSGAAQLNEYTPLKTALMRAQAGVGVGERQVKIISKRQAQEAVMLNTGKRPKPCPPSATTVSHMDVKAPDHSQMMVGQLLPTSSAVMTRINSESGGPLFSTNSFMSPVVRPTDGHCPPQGPPEQNQPGQIQQQQHFRHQEKSCEAQAAGSRAHHSNHLAQQDHLKPGQDHNAMQRMMSSRTLEQQLISPPSNPVSRSSDLACAPSRQERHRVSNYSAEALIGKSSTSGEQQQRMGLHLQPGHGAAQEQQDLRGYLDTSRGKANIAHNPQTRLPADHPGSADVQRVSECPPFKAMGGGGGGAHQLSGFEAQVSRGSDMAPKSVPPSQRGPQGQQQGGFRMNVGPPADGRNRGGYSGAHPGAQGVQVGPALPREQEGCHQSFMQSLLSPHLPEQSNHQRPVQCCPPVSMEYSCVPGSSAGDIQAKASSPSVPQTQKAPAMRLGEGNKGHISQVSSNMHGGPGVRAGLPHPPTPHSSSEPGRSSAPSRPPTAVSQHSRHIARDTQPTKLRPGDRPRSGALRPSNPFEPEGHLPLPSGGGVLLSRPQSGGEARRSTIVRFMADSAQVPSENNLVPDQHITQNFGFPFIPEGGMNPPPPINANSTFIPPVSQPSASRTPSLLPVEPQNTLPSFYPSYSPAAHPSLPSDVTLQYFPNQMFTSPSADKGSAPPLNNRFGSILSPPRPIASGMPTDGSAMPMSPLLSLSNTSSADSSKQPNRPAHNISHILGHDGSSAV